MDTKNILVITDENLFKFVKSLLGQSKKDPRKVTLNHIIDDVLASCLSDKFNTNQFMMDIDELIEEYDWFDIHDNFTIISQLNKFMSYLKDKKDARDYLIRKYTDHLALFLTQK